YCGWSKSAAIPGADKTRVTCRFRVEGRADFCRNQTDCQIRDGKIPSSGSRQGFGGLHPFINTINQRPTVRTLLPIEHGELPKDESEPQSDPLLGYVFEPTAERVLEAMLPYYLQYQIFQMILDARASEHSARMVAMKNATDNAHQFIKDLT